jgi:hypothetical protein
MSSGATENLRLAAGVGPDEAPIGSADEQFVHDLATTPYPELDPTPMYRRGLERGDYRQLPDLLRAPGATPRPVPRPADLAHDDRLVARLASRRHTGEEFKFFHEGLVQLGFATCRRVIKDGRLPTLCRDHDRPVGDLPDDVDPADVAKLAEDTAVDAATIFRRVILVEGQWHVGLGVRLVDLYFAARLHAYPTQYRAWFRRTIPPPPVPTGPSEAGLPELPPPAPRDVDPDGSRSAPDALDERDSVRIAFTRWGYPTEAILAVLGSDAASIARLRAAGRDLELATATVTEQLVLENLHAEHLVAENLLAENLVAERDIIGGIND